MFERSDAWLLQTLIYAREFSDRKHLTEIGDYINHSIFSDEEFEGGLQRLIEAGHALERGKKYAPSNDVLAWYDAAIAGKSRIAVLKDMERVKQFLGLPVS